MRPRPNSSLRTGGRLSIPRPLAALHRVLRSRALSSAVEHFLDMEGVRGSIPLAPTIEINGLARIVESPATAFWASNHIATAGHARHDPIISGPSARPPPFGGAPLPLPAAAPCPAREPRGRPRREFACAPRRLASGLPRQKRDRPAGAMRVGAPLGDDGGGRVEELNAVVHRSRPDGRRPRHQENPKCFNIGSKANPTILLKNLPK